MLLYCGVGEDSWESLGCKDIQPVHLKGDQFWVFIGRTDVEAETPIFWPSDAKCWLIWKDPDVGKDWRLEEKGTTEDEMVRWHHQLNGHGFGWTAGVGGRQGGLASCGSWGRKELDTTERLDWTELNYMGKESERVEIYMCVYYIKKSVCNVGDLDSIPGSGRSPGEGNSYPLQYSCLENPKERGAWWTIVYGVTKS